MTVDYFSLLTKAVAGRDTVERNKIYRDAYGLIARSNLTREVSASHIAALEDAIRRIEGGIAAEHGQKSAAEISQVLSTGRNWKPFIVGAFGGLVWVFSAEKGSKIAMPVQVPE